MDHLTEQRELDITPRISSTFVSLSGWMRTAAFVSLAALAVSLVSVTMDLLNAPQYSQAVTFQLFFTFIFLVISVIMNVLLLSASAGIKKGVISGIQETFNRGISKFTSYFRVIGIIMIIVLVALVGMLVIVCVAGLSGAFDGL